MEEWKDVVGFEGFYQVSSFGRVRGVDRHVKAKGAKTRLVKGKLLAQRKHAFGYWVVTLSARNIQYTRTVHSLVARAFLGEVPPGQQVCHKDGNPENAAASNLRYDSPRGNNADKRAHGTQRSGEDVYNAIFKDEDIVKMRVRRAAGEKLTSVARDFGVSEAYVFQVTAGLKWPDAGGPITPASKKPRVMNSEDIEAAAIMRRSGMTISEISAKTGFSRNQVWLKLKGTA